MSKTQLKVLWIGIIIVVLMGIFPPEQGYSNIGRRGSGNRLYIKGYDFILNVSNIAFTRLLIQWIIVCVITVGLIYSLKIEDYEQKKRKEENQSNK